MNNYEESIQAIKDLDCKVSVREWNEIAMKYNFLSTFSLARLSNKSFTQLCIDLKKRKKN